MSDVIAIQIVFDLSFIGSKNLVRQNGGPPMIYSEEKETQKNKIQNNKDFTLRLAMISDMDQTSLIRFI